MNIKMDIISGYKNSINTSQINNSGGVNLATKQGGHQQPAVLNKHEDMKYTRDQLLEIKQKVREYVIFKIISPELHCNTRRLRISKRGRKCGKQTKQGYRNCFRFNLQANQSNVTEIKINYTWSKAFRNNIMIGLINAQ